MNDGLMENDGIYLRALEIEDLDAVYMMENDSSMWLMGCNEAPVSRQLIYDYIMNYNADPLQSGQLRLMICRKDSDEAVGMVDLYQIDKKNRRAGVGIAVRKESREQGIAGGAMMLIEKYAYQVLGLHQLWAVIAVENEASRALFKHAGFKLCGHLQSWLRCGERYIDAYICQRMLTGKESVD